MTFEEKLEKATEDEFSPIQPSQRAKKLREIGIALQYSRWARQETLREVLDPKLFANEFMGCSIPDGAYPDNLGDDGKFQKGSTGTNMMNASEAEQMFKELFNRVIKKLEAEQCSS